MKKTKNVLSETIISIWGVFYFVLLSAKSMIPKLGLNWESISCTIEIVYLRRNFFIILYSSWELLIPSSLQYMLPWCVHLFPNNKAYFGIEKDLWLFPHAKTVIAFLSKQAKSQFSHMEIMRDLFPCWSSELHRKSLETLLNAPI